MTLTIVWEYIARHPDGYRYSRLCELYCGREARLSVTMRQAHRAGEKLFGSFNRGDEGVFAGIIRMFPLNVKARFVPADTSANEA